MKWLYSPIDRYPYQLWAALLALAWLMPFLRPAFYAPAEFGGIIIVLVAAFRLMVRKQPEPQFALKSTKWEFDWRLILSALIGFGSMVYFFWRLQTIESDASFQLSVAAIFTLNGAKNRFTAKA